MKSIKNIFTIIGSALMIFGVMLIFAISPDESLSAKILLTLVFVSFILVGLIVVMLSRNILKFNISDLLAPDHLFSSKNLKNQFTKSFPFIKKDQSKEKKDQSKEKPYISYVQCQRDAFRILLNNIRSVEITPDPSFPKSNINIKDYYLDTDNLRANTSISRLADFIVIDTETTGLQPGMNKIIQLTAIRFSNFQATEIFTTYINPGKPIPPDITKITGITDEMVSGSPSFESILPALSDFIGASTLVGHNLIFDIKFIRKFGYDNECSKRRYYDTLVLSRRIDKEAENHKLVTACEENGIEFPSAHSSEYDAFATGLLFISYVDKVIGLPYDNTSLHEYHCLTKKILKSKKEKANSGTMADPFVFT